jgi:hypothetical protein
MKSGTFVGLILMLGLGTTQVGWGRQPTAALAGQTVKIKVTSVGSWTIFGVVREGTDSISAPKVGGSVAVDDEDVSNANEFFPGNCPCPGLIALKFTSGRFSSWQFENEQPDNAEFVCDPAEKPEGGCPKE